MLLLEAPEHKKQHYEDMSENGLPDKRYTIEVVKFQAAMNVVGRWNNYFFLG